MTVAQMKGQWAEYKCTSREWLVSVDQINSEIVSTPFTVKLNKSLVRKSDYYLYYNIIPTIPVSSQARWVLKRHLVRVSPSGEFNVVHK